MNLLMPLLLRDWYEFRKHLISNLLFWVLMPIILHIFLAIPLSRFISMDIRYLNWSSGGIWVTTAGMAAFLQSANRMRKIQFETQQIDALLKAPISNLDLLSINILRGMLYGIGQLITAILITSTLNHEYLGIGGIGIICFQMLTLILHFSVVGTFLGLLISNAMLLTNISFFLFIYVSMGLGNFIPLENYPSSYLAVIENIPTTAAFANIKSVIIHSPFNWAGFFFTLLGTIILFIITLITSHKVLRKL